MVRHSYTKDPKRDPNIDNYPYDFRVEGRATGSIQGFGS